MPLSLTIADQADAARIAEIHMATFGSNAMFLAQFPTPAVRNDVKHSIELKALADIEDPKTTVLVVRDSSLEPQNSSAISFAKWAHPVRSDEGYVEPPWVWPVETDLDILNDWAKKTEETQLRILGNTPCYRLTFMGTDPAYQRRGAASMMVRWGIERSRIDQAPAYLESTLEAAPFYTKLGFTAAAKISLEYTIHGSDTPGTYEEVSFIYEPSK
ncbi:putative GNAT family acetyltransferase [Daldinia caldariorum]|uniref:putative GNAT family acetyltransferase n=1 Tax=Daldinia caldariorum TaxID=326644 RepID=UPI00200812FF|nr:putative GNAT family acetyltransferase [Daldinia caldariorum]KAI1467713.1 putative GNAT family acetyltransferase [Daldinia caldariorum]